MQQLDQLNDKQRLAVDHVKGPLLILAGAGSGKTKVITTRIADLILNRGVAPWAILAVTFTNKASLEMRNRVRDAVGPMAEDILIKTFHSACLFILRRDGDKIGIPSHFSIYDTQDSESLIKQILKSMDLDPKKFIPATILHEIFRSKDQLIDAIKYAEQAIASADMFREITAKIYRRYEELMREYQALDFNDLLMRTVELFLERSDVLQKYRDRWQYIMIDEYQDTNRVQYLLARLLANNHRNLCVVGDDDQSIYSWRGADIRNILDFQKDFPDAVIVKLEQNYRSTSVILDAAFHVVSKNVNRMEKKLWTGRDGGEKITQKILTDEREEAFWVIEKIRSLQLDYGQPLKEMAIFYRMNYQSRPFEEFLRSRNIPYIIYGGMKFYERKEVKDVLAYLRCVANPSDTIALVRIINTPARGIGGVTLGKMLEEADAAGIALWEVLERQVQNRKIGDFVEFMRKIRIEASKVGSEISLLQFVRFMVEATGYMAFLNQDDSPEGESRRENIQELLNSIADWEEMLTNTDEKNISSIERYLQEIGLYTDSENPDKQNQGEYPYGLVHLMTVHNAKGLEFTNVFLCGMEEGIFPHGSAVNQEVEEGDEMEEERRLCYVGITRAKDRLFMSCVRFRRQYGAMVPRMPSRFLDEIPAKLLNKDAALRPRALTREVDEDSFFYEEKEQFAHSRKKNSLRDFIPDKGVAVSEKGYSEGQRVRHPNYGEGTIERIVKNGNFVRLYISFRGQTPKPFLEKYTPLEKL